MPTSRLASFALYLVPDLGKELQELGFPADVPGYEQLRNKHAGAHRSGTDAINPPNARTAQKMMHHDEPAKYNPCHAILGLLNLERTSQSMPVLDDSRIEEREYTIPTLATALQSIATRQSVPWPGPGSATKVAERAKLEAETVVELSKGYLTTRAKCVAVLAAVQDLIGDPESKVSKSLTITAGHPRVKPRAIGVAVKRLPDAAKAEGSA